MTMRFCGAVLLPLLLFATGCSLQETAAPSAVTSSAVAGQALQGGVHGGQQPVVGAHVYLFAANSTGYGGAGIAASASNASISLLKASVTGNSDAVGAYV